MWFLLLESGSVGVSRCERGGSGSGVVNSGMSWDEWVGWHGRGCTEYAFFKVG